MGNDGSNPRRLALHLNEYSLGDAHLGQVREDVWRAFPALDNHTAGFNAISALPPELTGKTVNVRVVYESTEGQSFPFSVRYDLSRRQV
jgi:hypothetical protein